MTDAPREFQANLGDRNVVMDAVWKTPVTPTSQTPCKGMSPWLSMHPTQPPPKIQMTNREDYRESYANSVQVRVNLWDFFLMFGTVNQTAADSVSISNFQGIYLSPQQAKALHNVLSQNLSQYEATFGEIRLEPQGPQGSVIQ